jgi:CheY-like chemotaxis protein
MRTRVLIVDDDEDSRATYGRFLTSEGFTTDLAASGEECLRKLDRLSPNVILLDYRMHGMNGFECLQAIRARGAESPVALVTADLDAYDLESKIHELHAIIQLKLCWLDEIKILIEYLSAA